MGKSMLYKVKKQTMNWKRYLQLLSHELNFLIYNEFLQTNKKKKNLQPSRKLGKDYEQLAKQKHLNIKCLRRKKYKIRGM